MGAQALRLFAAGVCRSSKVGLVDAAREVVVGTAISSMCASRTGAHNDCGCRAHRALSIRPRRVFQSCKLQTIWPRERSIIDRTMSLISSPSTLPTCLRSPDSTSHNRRGGHIDIAGPMPVVSASGREYVHIAVAVCTDVVYARPLCLKSEAVKAVNAFRVAAGKESEKRIREIITDNAHPAPRLWPAKIPSGGSFQHGHICSK